MTATSLFQCAHIIFSKFILPLSSNFGIVSVLHQDEGGIGKSIPDVQEISRDPNDFPRAKPEGNLEGRGKFWGAEGMDFPVPPEFWWSTDILLIINPIPKDGSGNPSL